MEKVLVKWLNRITHRKTKPRKIECVEGVVFVLFKHSKVLVFIWKVRSGVKSSLICDDGLILFFSLKHKSLRELEHVVRNCNSQGFTLKGGSFPRKAGDLTDKNNQICLTGESLANLCHRDFSISLI